MQQIVDGALADEPKLVYQPGGPTSGELRTRRPMDRRRMRAEGSSWSLPQPAHEQQQA